MHRHANNKRYTKNMWHAANKVQKHCLNSEQHQTQQTCSTLASSNAKATSTNLRILDPETFHALDGALVHNTSNITKLFRLPCNGVLRVLHFGPSHGLAATSWSHVVDELNVMMHS